MRFLSVVVPSSVASEVPTSFKPRPAIPDTEEPVSKGFKSWKSLGVLFLANAIPIGGAYAYFKASVDAREKELEAFQSLSNASADQVMREVKVVTKFADTCLLLSSGSVLSVSPHPPEEQTLELIAEVPLGNFKYDPLVDVLTAKYVGDALPLSTIHFGMSSKSVSSLAESPSLIYSSRDRGELVTVSGTWEVVDDERLRDYYWRTRWGDKGSTALVRFKPHRVTLQSSRKPEDTIPPMICELNGEWKRSL